MSLIIKSFPIATIVGSIISLGLLSHNLQIISNESKILSEKRAHNIITGVNERFLHQNSMQNPKIKYDRSKLGLYNLSF